MEPVFAAARKDPKRLIYAEGEEERVLRAAQVVVDEGIARPILIGRPDVIAMRIERFGLRLKLGRRRARLVDRNRDQRHVDIGKARDRQGAEAHDAEEAEHDEDQDRRQRLADRIR